MKLKSIFSWSKPGGLFLYAALLNIAVLEGTFAQNPVPQKQTLNKENKTQPVKIISTPEPEGTPNAKGEQEPSVETEITQSAASSEIVLPDRRYFIGLSGQLFDYNFSSETFYSALTVTPGMNIANLIEISVPFYYDWASDRLPSLALGVDTEVNFIRNVPGKVLIPSALIGVRFGVYEQATDSGYSSSFGADAGVMLKIFPARRRPICFTTGLLLRLSRFESENTFKFVLPLGVRTYF